MAKKNKKGRKESSIDTFVALPWALLNSKAFKDMTSSAGKALPYFRGKIKLPFNDLNYHRIDFSLSYKEAISLGFSRGTFSKIIPELVGKGFIDPVEKGGLRGFGKTTSLFKLSERWKNYGTTEFKKIDWKTFF